MHVYTATTQQFVCVGSPHVLGNQDSEIREISLVELGIRESFACGIRNPWYTICYKEMILTSFKFNAVYFSYLYIYGKATLKK